MNTYTNDVSLLQQTTNIQLTNLSKSIQIRSSFFHAFIRKLSKWHENTLLIWISAKSIHKLPTHLDDFKRLTHDLISRNTEVFRVFFFILAWFGFWLKNHWCVVKACDLWSYDGNKDTGIENSLSFQRFSTCTSYKCICSVCICIYCFSTAVFMRIRYDSNSSFRKGHF